MPKETFYRLASNKQQRIIAALYTEFSRAPYSKTSITNIIESSDIPRGSFYQYFEDKRDAYQFLLKKLLNEAVNTCGEYIANNPQQPLAAFEKYGDDRLRELISGSSSTLLTNIFQGLDYKLMHVMFRDGLLDAIENNHAPLLDMIDTSNLRVNNRTELMCLMQQIGANFISRIYHFLGAHSSLSETQILSEWHTSMSWIAYGVCQPEAK